MRTRLRAEVLLLAGALSCGARTELDDGGVASAAASSSTGSSGTGGATSSSAASGGVTSSGTGGSGGLPQLLCGTIGAPPPVVACPALVQHPGLVVPTGTPPDLDQPALVDVCEVAPSVVLAFAGGKGPGTPRSAYLAAFDAWGVWPPPAPAAVAVTHDDGAAVEADVLLAAPQRPDPDVDLAVLTADSGNDSFYLDNQVTLDGKAPSFGTNGYAHPIMLGTRLNRAGTSYAISRSIGADALLTFTYMDLTPGAESGWTLNSACASTPMAAAAAPTTTGALFGAAVGSAFSPPNPPPLNGCAQYGPVTAATHLVFSRVDKTPGFAVGGTLESPAPVQRLRMAYALDGAWAAWSDGDGTLAVARLDETANVEATFTVLGTLGSIDGASFDIAPFGPGFVAAYVSVAVDGTEAIELHVFDAGGAEIAATTLPAPGATGALAVVPARTGDQLLVGWASAPSPGAPRALQVARVACEAP